MGCGETGWKEKRYDAMLGRSRKLASGCWRWSRWERGGALYTVPATHLRWHRCQSLGCLPVSGSESAVLPLPLPLDGRPGAKAPSTAGTVASTASLRGWRASLSSHRIPSSIASHPAHSHSHSHSHVLHERPSKLTADARSLLSHRCARAWMQAGGWTYRYRAGAINDARLVRYGMRMRMRMRMYLVYQ